MPKKEVRYWACGLNFDYDVQAYFKGDEPDPAEWGGIRGPFKTFAEAKKHVREWIANDRYHLSSQLDLINRMRAPRP